MKLIGCNYLVYSTIKIGVLLTEACYSKHIARLYCILCTFAGLVKAAFNNTYTLVLNIVLLVLLDLYFH